MSRRSLSYLAVLLIASVLGMIACSGDNTTSPSVTTSVAAPATDNGRVRALSYDFDPNCMILVEEANIIDGGLIPNDYVLRVKLNLTKNVCDEIHLAAFFLGDIGSQELIGYASKNVSGMQSYWMMLPLDRNKVNKNCGISIQSDLGKGLIPPAHGSYPFTIADWRIGNPCGGVKETPSPTPEPTPTPTVEPTPTPTPHCNEEVNALTVGEGCDPTPEPTVTPTATPTVTPTRTPTPTPTPVPCDITPDQADGLYCLDSPLGSEAAEAAWLGIDAGTLVTKIQVDALTWTSDGSYAVVLLKDGKCGSDNKGVGYHVYSNVLAGQVLTYNGSKDISHATIFGFACPVN